MATETEQLVVQLEARINDFEKNMAKASGTASREFGAIERRGKESASKLERAFGDMSGTIKARFTDIGKELLIGGASALVSEESLRAIHEVVKSVAEMADQAKSIGLPVEDFQALAFAGHQSGVETGKIVDLFQKFNVEVSKAKSEGNELSKILEANGVSLIGSNGQLRSQKELFYEVVRLISNARNQQEAAAVAVAAFGKAAQDALPFLQQGAEAIKQGENDARETGAIIDKELVARAHEFDDKWTAAMDSWSAKGKSAVLGIMSDMSDLMDMADSFLAKTVGKENAKFALGQALRTNPLTASSMWLYDHYASGTPYEPMFGGGTQTPANGKSDGYDDAKRSKPTIIPVEADLEAAKKKTKELDAQRAALAKLLEAQRFENSSLELEARTMTMSTFEASKARKEAELLNQAKRAGIPINDGLKNSISELATEYARGQVAIENVRKAQELTAESAKATPEKIARMNKELEGAFGGAMKGFFTDMLHGADAVKALQTALSNLADNLLNMAFDRMFEGMFSGSGGGTTKALGGSDLFKIFGLAEGGHVQGPGTGTSDSIPAMLSNGEYVVRASETAKHKHLLDAINGGRVPKFASGGLVGNPVLAHAPSNGKAGDVTLNTSVNVNATGGDPKQNDDLAKKVAKEVEGHVRGVVVKELMAQMRPGNMLTGR